MTSATQGSSLHQVPGTILLGASQLPDMPDVGGPAPIEVSIATIASTSFSDVDAEHPAKRFELTENNLDLAKNYISEGSVLLAQENLEGAEEAFQKALEIRRTCLGEIHQDVAEIYFLLGKVLKAKKDLNGAKEICEKAVQIWESLDSESDTFLECCNFLADLLQSLRRPNGAKKYRVKAKQLEEIRFATANHFKMKQMLATSNPDDLIALMNKLYLPGSAD